MYMKSYLVFYLYLAKIFQFIWESIVILLCILLLKFQAFEYFIYYELIKHNSHNISKAIYIINLCIFIQKTLKNFN